MSRHEKIDWETGFVLVVSPEGLNKVPFSVPVLDTKEKMIWYSDMRSFIGPMPLPDRPLIPHQGYTWDYAPFSSEVTGTIGKTGGFVTAPPKKYFLEILKSVWNSIISKLIII